MSIDISVCNDKQTNCDNIINKLLKAGIEARVIETTSIFENNIEKGCLITLGKEYNTPKKITNVWDTISSDYICAHIKIKGLFDGCIYDYFSFNNTSNCPHNKSDLL
tara:strand:- start:1284 stop:1604 length:321 start_codon:yes stop_codon:yes gene_type:complete